VKVYPTPELDTRDAAKILSELLARRPAYIPEVGPQQGRPAYGLFQIFSQYMQAIVDMLNQAPDKNLMAFLDMLGVSLIPAMAASSEEQGSAQTHLLLRRRFYLKLNTR